MTADNFRTSHDGALAIAAMEARLRDVERAVGSSGPRIYPTTTSLGTEILKPYIGQRVQVGTLAGTGTAMPRYYTWTGSVWVPSGWWAAAGRIGCSLYSASRAIGAGATDTTVYANEVYDYDGGHVATTGTTFTVSVAGVYAISDQEVLSTLTSGVLAVAIMINGGAIYGNSGPAPFGVAGASLTAHLTVGQTVGINVYSSNALSHTSHLHVQWMHP